MKAFIFLSIGILFVHYCNAQIIYDYKVKNSSNVKERTLILDIYRAKLYGDYKQEFIFVVNHFKVGSNYAWLMAEVQRTDGKQVKMPDEGDAWDCCHVEALFKKNKDKWLIVESIEFSTDVWWQGISKRYRQAPPAIFDNLGRN